MHLYSTTPWTLGGGSGSLAAEGGKNPSGTEGAHQFLHKCRSMNVVLRAVALLAASSLCIVAHAVKQSHEHASVYQLPAFMSAKHYTEANIEKGSSRLLAAANNIQPVSASWKEAEELPAHEAATVAALWDALASSSTPSRNSQPHASLDARGGPRTNRSRTFAGQNTPNDPQGAPFGDSAATEKPRYRVVGEEGGNLYELAKELEHDPESILADLIMTANGLKPNTTTTTTTTTTTPPILRFRQCADASARGYSMPFACCSVQNGDFYDRRTWHCGRIPTSLDAVFIRHFVRLPASRTQLELRALWIVKSIDTFSKGKTGVLRSGQVPGSRCTAGTSAGSADAAAAPSIEELSTLREVFGDMLSGEVPASKASLSDLCDSLRAEPFSKEDDFLMERPTVIIIRDPGNGPLERTAAEIAYTGTTEALNAESGLRDEADAKIVDRVVHVETNVPAQESRGRDGNAGRAHSYARTVERAADKTQRLSEDSPTGQDAATSPIVPFDFGRVFRPVAQLEKRLPQSPQFPYSSARARGLGIADFSRSRKFAEPLSLSGMSTMRVEPGAALLLLSGYWFRRSNRFCKILDRMP